MKILIIGAGIGGLCLGQLLKKNGIQVQIFERDHNPFARMQGYRLHLDADGISALKDALPEELFQLVELTSTNPLPYTTILNTAFGLAKRFPIGDYSKTEHHVKLGIARHLNVNRATLREILLKGLEVECTFGVKFTHYESDENGVVAYFENGLCQKGDVLIGADGAGSIVRKFRAPEAKFMDSGARAIYGRIKIEDARKLLPGLCISDVFTAVSDARKLIMGVGPVMFPVRPELAGKNLGVEVCLTPQDDYVGCIISGRKEFFGDADEKVKEMNSNELQHLAKVLVSEWPSNASEIVAAGEEGSFFYIEMSSSIPFDLITHPNITLLGDAVHAMTPSLGRGANVALRDAALLGEELSKVHMAGKSLPNALRDYEQEMTGYGFNVVRQSAEMGTKLLGQDPLPDH